MLMVWFKEVVSVVSVYRSDPDAITLEVVTLYQACIGYTRAHLAPSVPH
jgi:hypothetical protein